MKESTIRQFEFRVDYCVLLIFNRISWNVSRTQWRSYFIRKSKNTDFSEILHKKIHRHITKNHFFSICDSIACATSATYLHLFKL